MAADIVIFATPVWWGIQSSLIQRVIERLDEIHDEIMETGKSKLTDKVAGIIVSGDSDGAEHIIGNLANFFSALSFTLPPFSTLTVL
jgi:multimeric flavodoxin WrbA